MALEKPEIDFTDGPAPAELVIRDLIVGDGAEAKPGDTVTVHYLGVEYETGEEFDSSWNRGERIQFPLRGLIQGWQDGIPGMKVGGRRELVIPPQLAYGTPGGTSSRQDPRSSSSTCSTYEADRARRRGDGMSQAQRTERLLNLLFVLMASRRPVPKAALRTSLQDYAESPSDAAFERMFERDKEELRSMGIPIETVEGSIGAGGIDGYRVRGDEYALPEVSFSAEELTVLALAARVWEQASLGPAARSALRKLEASGGEAPHDPSGLIARVTTPEPSFPAFLAACQARRPVTFDYRKPSETTPRTRRLEPWGVLSRKGHWYVAGQDPTAARHGCSGSPGWSVRYGPTRRPPRRGVRGPGSRGRRRADPYRSRPGAAGGPGAGGAGAAASLRRSSPAAVADPGHPGWDVLEPTYADDESFAERLVGHGRAVVVLDPPDLRAAVVRRLEAAVAAGATR